MSETAIPVPEKAEEPREPSSPPVEYRLTIREDKMAVLLDHPDPAADVHAAVDRILASFVELELADAPDGPDLEDLLTEAATPGEPLLGFPIAQGREPIAPVDGHLEWAREFFTEGWAIDEESGAIDFWEKLERRSVHSGESLLTMVHPVEGVPGVNVLGQELTPPKPGKIKVRCGKGVEQSEREGHTDYRASVDGRVRWADGTIAVDDVYAIRGDVSLETGNIHHTGSVVIDGEVSAGALIEADGDIVVKGMVEAATIICGGALTVAGGILGSEDTHIAVTGELRAKYISEARVDGLGDITVANEIAHSMIRTRGKVEVEKGRIAGGETVALRGIEVAEAGASGSTHTLLVAGVDYTLREKLAQRHQRVDQLEGTLKKIVGVQDKVQQSRQAMTETLSAKLAELSEKEEIVAQAVAKEKEAILRITRTALADAVEEIVILAELWSGTTLQLGEYKHNVRSSVQRPRIAQIKKKKVHVLPLGDGNMPEE